MSTATGFDSSRAAFWRGFWEGAPFVLGVAPFGLLFGILATEAGFDLLKVMSMSILVIAGAAQFTALAQMQDGAPVFIVLVASLAVNLRMAMYSASIAPHLGPAPLWQRALAAYILVDNTYALGVARFEADPQMPTPRKVAYYFGSAIPAWVVWYVATFSGAWFGAQIPPAFALDFAPAIIFLSLIAPMLRTLAHVAAALTSVVVALALAFLPYSTGLLIAAVAAMVVGAVVETGMERRR